MTWMICRTYPHCSAADRTIPTPCPVMISQCSCLQWVPAHPAPLELRTGWIRVLGGASPSVFNGTDGRSSTLGSSVPSLPPPLPSFGQHTSQQSSRPPASPMSTNSPHCPGGAVFVIGCPSNSTSGHNICTPPAQSAFQQGRSTSRGRGRNRRGRGRRRFRPYGSVSQFLHVYPTVTSCVLNSTCVHVSIRISCLWYHSTFKVLHHSNRISIIYITDYFASIILLQA